MKATLTIVIDPSGTESSSSMRATIGSGHRRTEIGYARPAMTCSLRTASTVECAGA